MGLRQGHGRHLDDCDRCLNHVRVCEPLKCLALVATSCPEKHRPLICPQRLPALGKRGPLGRYLPESTPLRTDCAPAGVALLPPSHLGPKASSGLHVAQEVDITTQAQEVDIKAAEIGAGPRFVLLNKIGQGGAGPTDASSWFQSRQRTR